MYFNSHSLINKTTMLNMKHKIISMINKKKLGVKMINNRRLAKIHKRTKRRKQTHLNTMNNIVSLNQGNNLMKLLSKAKIETIHIFFIFNII